MPKKSVPEERRKPRKKTAPHDVKRSPGHDEPRTDQRDSVLDDLDRLWHAFWHRYRDTRLAGEAHYSLPPPLLNSLESNVRGFFSRSDIEFEREFFATASFGVFHGQALGETSTHTAEMLASAQRTESAVRYIQFMIDQERARIGISNADIQEAHCHRNNVNRAATSLRHGYIGWLVSNAEFHHELRDLRIIGESAVASRGRFPTRSELASEVATHEVAASSLESRLLDFYRRWSLDRLLTWEWPEPMRPEFFGSLLHPPETSTEAGISLFLPWSVMQGGRIVNPDLISVLKIVAVPAHLRDWVVPGSDQTSKKAADYFELRTKLYRYDWLSLQRRYPDRFHRKRQAVDAAFADWLELKTDTITRHRLSLAESLSSLSSSSGSGK